MLFVGNDWAEDHHDIELQDETGRVLAIALSEGAAGVICDTLGCFVRFGHLPRR